MRKLIALLLLAAPLAAGATGCRYSADHSIHVDAANLHALALHLGSSDTVIEGVPGLARIEVKATACASRRSGLRGFDVHQERHGDSVVVTAEDGDHGSFSGLFGYRYMKLHVRVPKTLAVRIHSGSADVDARDLASLVFDSGSGDLRAHHIAGGLKMDLGSADALIDDVGSLRLGNTGSGDVQADGVHGDVSVGNSGSGDLHFAHVDGSVSVEGTGSGDIGVRHVRGDVRVGHTGSGDVDADDVGGNLTVGSVGSGDVSYDDVHGKISVPRDDD